MHTSAGLGGMTSKMHEAAHHIKPYCKTFDWGSKNLPKYRNKFGWLGDNGNSRLLDEIYELRKMFQKHLNNTRRPDDALLDLMNK